MYALAWRTAKTSECDDQHGAVLTMGSRVLKTAVNSAAGGGRGLQVTQHAELRLVRDTRNWRQNHEGGTVYSARFHAFPISKPCEECQEALRESGIVRVVYHDGWQLHELGFKGYIW
jgi:deoxycytidylate deaminase